LYLEYRNYAISSGWIYSVGGTTDATDAPSRQDFSPIIVDFGEFLQAPSTYSGALYGLQVAGSIVAMTAVSILF